MKCDSCRSNRIVSICSKASDLHNLRYRNLDHDGYLLNGFGIGGGDYVEFDFCLECGKIQGNFPITDESIAEQYNEDRFDDEESFKFADVPTNILEEENPDPEELQALIERYKKLSADFEKDAEAMPEEEWREYKDIRNAVIYGEASEAVMRAFQYNDINI